MGLGKTLQTIALFAAIKEGIVKPLSGDATDRRPHLLVVPPTLLFNWENEVKIFCPGLYVHEYTGKGRSLIGIREGIVITTYDIARRDIETLREAKFDCVVFDEAQNVKNLMGERSKAMRQLEGRCKFTLTGTPLENHAGEYYSIIDLSLPGLFGDYREFMNALKQPNGVFNPLDRARPFVLRRTKDKILTELPPKVESDMHLDLSEEQKRFYTRAVADVRAEVFEAFKDKTAQQAGIVALAALTRLRQICVSPALIDPTHTETSPKMQYLIEKLEELNTEGHAALVFSQFTKCLDLIETHLKASGIAFQRLDGSTPQQNRKKLVEAFQTGKGPSLFLISLKAGGAGLNLTRASYVFHVDPWWNPAAENQASDRAHRMGQKQTVFIQRLLMRHTIEEKIMLLKAQKRELFDQVLAGTEGDRSTGGAIITRDDFKFLLE
jgi:non-specific serine/threonine protein kinase